MTRLWPSLLGMAQVVQPETILRWHRVGFTAFWRWKSRNRTGRPKIDRWHLRQILRAYAHYYNEIRTHWSLDKDTPVYRPVQRIGSINSRAILGGLHHHYVRV